MERRRRIPGWCGSGRPRGIRAVVGEIAAKESGFAVLNDAGEEIETLVGRTVEGKPE